MCFYSEPDWIAQVCEEEEGIAPADSKCGECGRRIHKGQWRHRVEMQEHELCQQCEETYDDEPEPCEDDKHEYGETFEMDTCERCYRLRHAVRQVEESEGCTGSEAEPAYGGLYNDVNNGEGWQHYADAMAALRIPELALVPSPYPDDVFESLEDDYPGVLDWDDDPADEFVDIGGEG